MAIGYNDINISSGWNELIIPLNHEVQAVSTVYATLHSPVYAIRAIVETVSWANSSVTVRIYNFESSKVVVGVAVQVYGK